ncbi:hypothetical protein ES705_16075 [subsurface metagenome]
MVYTIVLKSLIRILLNNSICNLLIKLIIIGCRSIVFAAALDLGTTSCRTFIFDLAGTIIASDYQEWESYYYHFCFLTPFFNL